MGGGKFSLACASAESDLKSWLESGKLYGGIGAEELLLWWALEFRHEDGPDGAVYKTASQGALTALCALALTRHSARNLMTEVVSGKLMCGVHLSPNEARLAGLIIAGGLPKLDVKRGPKRERNFERNMFIVILMETVMARFSLAPTRNDETAMPESACDAVSVAFVRAGHHEVTYRAVKAIWLDKKHRNICRKINVVMTKAVARKASLNALAAL